MDLEEKFNRVRRSFCFYLDIKDHELARLISRRIQDMGLQQEVFLTERVSHVIRDHAARRPAAPPPCPREGRARADAMLQRIRDTQLSPPCPRSHTNYIELTVHKALNLLDKIYDTFFTAPRKPHVRFFTKPFIKIEFLDKLCKPIYKEFNEWPLVNLEPDPPREKKVKRESPNHRINITTANNNTDQKMTRKSRPRIKEREEKELKGGYCEMCNTEYLDIDQHRRSPQHLAFVRDPNNFLALDSLISSGADVATFLDKVTPINGERRSLRKICNGDIINQSKCKPSKKSQSPDSTINGNQSPRRNGTYDDEKKHNTRCSKRITETEDRQYYKVVGVNTKLRSSGGLPTKRKDSSPLCNGTKPLVVKFRKVRRSELSVLSDEAEQFMFPKRASSTSSTSSDEDDEEVLSPKRKSPPKPPPIITERRRLARPLALKEESSEEDSWFEDKRRRKRRGPAVAKRSRRVSSKAPVVEPKEESDEPKQPVKQILPLEPAPEAVISPLREEKSEKCMKWEDGRLKYTPAVEQLEFAFESVPLSEPWYETFKRQDEDKLIAKNIPQYFEWYTKSPKLPYELGQLPPLKPNCCPLSDLMKREDKPGPSRAYGTRGMKKQRIRKRTAAILALENHPRKSPREHASTLAILGSAGLLHRRKHAVDDNKSTASEDTASDSHNEKAEAAAAEAREASERLQQFLSEVFEDGAEFEMPDGAAEAEPVAAPLPDVSSLLSECDHCDAIRNEIADSLTRPKGRRGRIKKKNRTGWPSKKKQTKKDSRTNSIESELKVESSLDRSSAEPPDDDTTRGTLSEEDHNVSETEKEDKTFIDMKSEDESQDKTLVNATCVSDETLEGDKSDDSQLQLDLKVVVDEKQKKRASRSSEEEREREIRKKKRALQGLGEWLQPVVRVARVDAARRSLRSAARPRAARLR